VAQSALSRIRVSAPCFFLGCAADGGFCHFPVWWRDAVVLLQRWLTRSWEEELAVVVRVFCAGSRDGAEMVEVGCVTELRRSRWRCYMFRCIRVRKRQQCCDRKIGGETAVTNNLLSQSSMDQIQYRAVCERSIM